MNRQELEALLRSEEVRQDGWISDENTRKQRYRELIVSGDRLALLKMIRALHIHKREQAKLGRKFHLSDENFLRDAEKLLNAEFSLVLGIDSAQVPEYIRSALDA
jgi:CarD family transcriptional regulator